MTSALILAAGRGERLRPLTNDKPKCMVLLQGRPLIDHQLNTLRKCQIFDILVATGYRSELIDRLGISTTNNPHYAATNMVATLFYALPFQKNNSDLVISYGDIVYQRNNLQELLNCEGDIAVMVDLEWRDLWEVRMDNPLDDAETLVLDDKDYILELGKKTSSYEQIHGQYTGLIKIRSDKISEFIKFYEMLDQNILYDGKTFKDMHMTSFLQLLIDANWKVKAAKVRRGWLEVDCPTDLEKYDSLYSTGTLCSFYKPDDL